MRLNQLVWFFTIIFVVLSENLRRCGTEDPSEIEFKTAESLRESASVPPKVAYTVFFNLTFHIFENTDKTIFVPEESIHAQFNHLFSIFQKADIHFFLKTIRYEDDIMAKNCLDLKNDAYKLANNFESDRSLHVFVCDLKNTNRLLGYAQMPCTKLNPFSSVRFDGVAWVDFRTLPLHPLALSFYDQGNSLVHEMGHVLGLYHTFHQNNCYGLGDFIADTPVEAGPYFGEDDGSCNFEHDTCVEFSGFDSVANFMNYSPDKCMTDFTPIQLAKMKTETGRCGLLEQRFPLDFVTTCFHVKNAQDLCLNPCKQANKKSKRTCKTAKSKKKAVECTCSVTQILPPELPVTFHPTASPVLESKPICHTFATREDCNLHSEECRYLDVPEDFSLGCRSSAGCRERDDFCAGLCKRVCLLETQMCTVVNTNQCQDI